MDEQGDKKTGYKNPPYKTRFKPGQSGNPKGRRKGAVNLSTAFFEEANERIPIVINGRKVRVSKIKVAFKRLFQMAIEGNPRAIAKVIEISHKLEPQRAAAEFKEAMSRTDEEILRDYLRANEKPPSEEKQSRSETEGGENDAV